MTSVKVLKGVEGVSGRFNDVVIKTNASFTKRLCIFFGGDVQNYEELMVAHRDHGQFKDYSLEKVTDKLFSLSDPYLSVICIRPSRMERNTFACYDNFVQCNFCGAPSHEWSKGNRRAANHLLKLLHHVDDHLQR